MSLSARRKKAVRAAVESGLDALIVTHLADIQYLTGFTGSAGVLVLSDRSSALFTDGRYSSQAKEEAKGIRVEIAGRPALPLACEWVEASGARRCGFDPERTSVAALKIMQRSVSARLRRSLFYPTQPLLARLREIKGPTELAAMRSAAELGCRLFDEVLGTLVPGATEAEVASSLEYRAKLAGAQAMSFETIVAAGVRSSLPHGRATSAKLPRSGFVTLDFGVVLGGYCSDMTRTVHLGKLRRKERDVYDSVLEAQQTALAAVRAGVKAGDVDEAARSVFRRDKLDSFFTHSTGHGVGLEIHEGPRLGANQEQVLEQGMVVTIEPGLYLPGRFGVRIEDMVLVTRNGGEVLTPSTKTLIEL